MTCIFELLRHRPSVLSMRCSGCIVNNDDSDDSVNSLFSFVDDHYDTENHWNRSWAILYLSHRNYIDLEFFPQLDPLWDRCFPWIQVVTHQAWSHHMMEKIDLFRPICFLVKRSNYSCSSSISSKKIKIIRSWCIRWLVVMRKYWSEKQP